MVGLGGKDDQMQFIHVELEVGSAADGELDINTGIDNPFLSGYIMHIHEIQFDIEERVVYAASSRKICALATRTGIDLGYAIMGDDIIAGYGRRDAPAGANSTNLPESGTKYWRANEKHQIIPYAGSKLYFIAEQTASASTDKFHCRIGYTLEKATKERIIEALELWNMPAQ